MNKILVLGKKGRIDRYTKDKSILNNFEFCYVENGTNDEEIVKVGKDAEFIIVDAISSVSADIINGLPKLKMIHSEGVAFNKIDIEAAKNKGIYVCNCKGMNATAVAEHAIMLMIGLLRDVCTGDKAVREGRQMCVKEEYIANGSLRELGECTIGLIGFGDIAKATAKMAAAFGAKIIYYNRTRATADVEREYNASFVTLDQLLSTSDIVSIHLPVTKDTQGMANEEFFSKMKQGSYFINTARGELVDEAALLEALRTGHITGAGLDTICNEPVKKDNFMLSAEPEIQDKIIYSCHIGGITGASFLRGYEMIWSDIHKVIAGEKPEHIVNGL